MAALPTIMVVNDDPVNGREVAAALERAGSGTVCSSTVETALDTVEQQQPAIVLINIQHRAKGGLLLAVTLRIKAETSAIPIVVMSPFPEHRLLGPLLSNFGIEASIGKPFSARDAVACIAAHLRLPGPPSLDASAAARAVPGEREHIPIKINK